MNRLPQPRGPAAVALPRVTASSWSRAVYDTPLLLAGVADLSGRVLDANRQSVEAAGWERGDVIGVLFWDGPWWGTDDDVRARIRGLCEDAARRGALIRAESIWWPADGSERHVDLAIHPVPEAGGEPTRLFLSGLDTTDRVHAQRAAAASARSAAQLLQQTSDERADSILALRAAQADLAGSLLLSAHILDNVADGIYGLGGDRTANFVNPAGSAMLGYPPAQLLGRDLHRLLHRQSDGSACDPAVCVTSRAFASGKLTTSQTEVFRRADGTLSPVEVVAVPTLAGGAVQGVVVSFRDLTERLAAEAQSEQLRSLTRLESDQRVLSDQLQQALLTAPPSPAGLAMAVRYRPAAAQAQVGGDWYDAFVQPDGTTMLVIGDVVGHDSSAASAMGQLRGLLRGIAFGSAERPAALLTRLDAAVQGLNASTMATIVLARVEAASPTAEPRRVTWSNAGHPPPAHLNEDGAVTILRTEPDLLIGIEAATNRTNHSCELAPGSSLVLFTDGLIERRGEDLDLGLDNLSAALTGLAGTGVEQLCDEVLARLLPAAGSQGHAGDDDVALLAVRCY